mgnify:CR=1 FL=1
MSEEDLEKFKEIMAAPVFTNIVQLHGSYDSRVLRFFWFGGAKGRSGPRGSSACYYLRQMRHH